MLMKWVFVSNSKQKVKYLPTIDFSFYVSINSMAFYSYYYRNIVGSTIVKYTTITEVHIKFYMESKGNLDGITPT